MDNNDIDLNDIIENIHTKYEMVQGISIRPLELIFEERVKMNCFYCGKYNHNWKCPPRIPELDYPKIVNEFQNGAILFLRMSFIEDNFNFIRRESSNILHNAMLQAEKFLFQNNNSTALSFIGGSCKLCKGGCGKEACNNPYDARTPIEAIGINVVESLKKYDFPIEFPPKGLMTRVGLLLY